MQHWASNIDAYSIYRNIKGIYNYPFHPCHLSLFQSTCSRFLCSPLTESLGSIIILQKIRFSPTTVRKQSARMQQLFKVSEKSLTRVKSGFPGISVFLFSQKSNILKRMFVITCVPSVNSPKHNSRCFLLNKGLPDRWCYFLFFQQRVYLLNYEISGLRCKISEPLREGLLVRATEADLTNFVSYREKRSKTVYTRMYIKDQKREKDKLVTCKFTRERESACIKSHAICIRALLVPNRVTNDPKTPQVFTRTLCPYLVTCVKGVYGWRVRCRMNSKKPLFSMILITVFSSYPSQRR